MRDLVLSRFLKKRNCESQFLLAFVEGIGGTGIDSLRRIDSLRGIDSFRRIDSLSGSGRFAATVSNFHNRHLTEQVTVGKEITSDLEALSFTFQLQFH